MKIVVIFRIVIKKNSDKKTNEECLVLRIMAECVKTLDGYGYVWSQNGLQVFELPLPLSPKIMA